ncbi:ATP-dependent DNA helicase RecG [Aquipuribacter nitratireducens]|uniref:ATP-dependent DNA helicase RecG n=1 Tax=Aquipuribacter nitratireducens TaxID=650104 RepID=A0ABW0GKM2_9MICO
MSASAAPGPPRSRLDTPLSRELGKKAADRLETLGLRSVADLLEHYPRRWTRRGDLTSFDGLREGEHVTVQATVAKASTRAMRHRRGTITEIVVRDGAGREIDLVFFNQSWRKEQLAAGTVGFFSGKVSRRARRLQLLQPDLLLGRGAAGAADGEADAFAAAFAGGLAPVYPASARAQTWHIGKAVGQVLDTLRDEDVPDPVPADVRARHGLLPRAAAVRAIHRPADEAERDAGERTLRFTEAYVLQAGLLRARARARLVPATRYGRHADDLLARFDAALPFPLTAGQERVGHDLEAELSSGTPMQRLLQGDVGSGKTLVALRAMLTVVGAGGQAALLAPTEVLAAQHHRSLTALLGPLGRAGTLDGDPDGTRVTLLTGSMPVAARRKALLEIVTGEAGIVVGTHALLSETVEFADLGIVVVDEQHRFGVEQRDTLRARGVSVHVLVMTATPIPRTVAMTVFGDLDTSVLDELPAGRQPVATHVVAVADHPAWIERVWARVREEVDEGRQAFVVCQRIGADGGVEDGDQEPAVAERGERAERDENDEDDAPRPPAAAAVDVHEALQAEPALAGLRIGLLHGRMSSEDKDAVMTAVLAGEVDVLVATTVVEVGVDVPNASVMVVLDADRFGVSQLHQLRGRIGRGGHAGVCLLVTGLPAPSDGRERLDAVASTTDGFALARFDLQARREGDVLGSAQSGARSSLRLLRVVDDVDVITTAREEVAALLVEDPELDRHPELREAVDIALAGGREEWLARG